MKFFELLSLVHSADQRRMGATTAKLVRAFASVADAFVLITEILVDCLNDLAENLLESSKLHSIQYLCDVSSQTLPGNVRFEFRTRTFLQAIA